MGRRLLACMFVVAMADLHATTAGAQTAPPEPDPTFTLRTSIKAAALAFLAPDAPLLFPDRTGGESLWRVRIEPEVKTQHGVDLSFAYEQRLRYTSTGSGLASLGVLPLESPAPYRIQQLDWSLSEGTHGSWHHEVDRANARIHAGATEITVGRQAVGWGRGVLFGAVDLFAPFSPLEADREWRRGIDAARADVKVTDQASIDVVSAFGTSWDRSLVAGRVRGYRGTVDVEAVGGRRARDLFAGFTTSAAVGEAELHGEVAAFHLPEPLPLGDARTIWKAVGGGSYRVPVGSGILFYAEYHYSGFGARKSEDIVRLLSDPAFAERYLRGDTQILSRHAAAIVASYEQSPTPTFSGQWIHNPVDRSGVAAPGVTITFSDRLSLYTVGYVPYGATPAGITLRSEYGTASRSAFLQLRVYL